MLIMLMAVCCCYCAHSKSREDIEVHDIDSDMNTTSVLLAVNRSQSELGPKSYYTGN
jgi:hypothetical protein